jgi:hypothetical protein
VRGDLVAAELPNWEGTPFHPHCNRKGVGVDCKGLLWGVAELLGFPEAHSEYATDLNYALHKPKGVPSEKLREGFGKLFDPVELRDRRPGDIFLCKWGPQPGHIAILGFNDRAWNALPQSCVRSRSLPVLFYRFPLDSVWRWRA